MRIGMLGSGDIARGVAKYALEQGHEVLLCNRSEPAKLAPIVATLGPGAMAVSRAEAAVAEIVLLAVPWESVQDVLTGLPPWNGRIVIDATNPFLDPAPLLVMPDLEGRTSSEIVADLVPGARLVKAFNTMFATKLAEGPRRNDARRVLFVSGDDEPAKTTVRNLIESFGFATIDLGNLKDGSRMQQAKTSPLAGPDFLLPDEPRDSERLE
jgi:8-hydroxy-5-deazaflavin:NADPH oxidoreductase